MYKYRLLPCLLFGLAVPHCTLAEDPPPYIPPQYGDRGPGDTFGGDNLGGDNLGGDNLGGDTGGQTTCANSWPQPSSGVCDVTPGNNNLLIRGNIILPDSILDAAEVLVVGGNIVCVDCDCSGHAAAASATVLTCPEGLVSPGLINAHDHITYTEADPADHGTERYEHRHEWRKGLNGHTKIPVSRNSETLGEGWGEMRQLMAGTTSVFGSGGERGFLRNLDMDSLLEGLQNDDAKYNAFPLDDSDGYMATSGCGGYNIDNPATAVGYPAYVPHVSEGINDAARNEFLCTSGLQAGGKDLVFGTSAFIHGIGVKASDIALMASESTGLVWSPRSNTDLYGMTAEVQTYDRLGVVVALGTDWTASGSMHILRELACAEDWNNVYWNGYFSDADLVAMVTRWAAEVLGFSNVLGSITVGKVADLAIWDASSHTGYRAILDAGTADVALVLRAGVPMYGDATLVTPLTAAGDCDTFTACDTQKAMCTKRELGATTASVRAQLSGAYDLFFCETPDNEPSCVPVRPGQFDGIPSVNDSDGDGVADATDNCIDVFNPLRPVDGPTQANSDGDSLGDACDPCPLNANTTSCASIDPDDIDSDGVDNLDDLCPEVHNPDQLDSDGDGKGDACDLCPNDFNPDNQGCPFTIYEVKLGDVAFGEPVFINNGIVTATSSNGFFISTDPAGSDWAGPDFSSIYVYYTDQPQAAVGTKVGVNGVVADYYGETEIDHASIVVLDAGPFTVAPLAVAPADIAPGGDKELAYEAVLVRVTDVEVLDTTPPGAVGETVTNEFTITGGLTVDDGLYLITPFPTEGQTLPGITGVLRYLWNRNKLQPRTADDVALGPPSLKAFGPATSYIYVGDNGPTAPELTATLTHEATEDIFVAITVTAGNPSDLMVTGGGVTIAAGSVSAPVLLSAVNIATEPFELTATLDTVTLTSQVIVLDPAILPLPISITPATDTAAFSATRTFTVNLDRPAPTAGQTVILGVSGVAGVGLPSEVIVPGYGISADFGVTAGTTAGVATITATIGTDTVVATLEVINAPPVGLLLAEVFYNPAGADTLLEWVRLYNGTGAELDLSTYSLGWGGTDYAFGTHQLSGTVAAGACFVVGGPTSSAANFSPVFDQAGDLDPDIQNGGTDADGLALFDVVATAITSGTVPIDAVVYGEPATNNNDLLGTDGTSSPVLVNGSGSGGSLIRMSVDTWLNSNDAGVGPYAECIALE